MLGERIVKLIVIILIFRSNLNLNGQNIEDIKPLIRAHYHGSQAEDLDAVKAIIAEVCEVIDWVGGFINIFATHRAMLTIPVRLLTVAEPESTEETNVQAKDQET
jgi:hypothetical protein